MILLSDEEITQIINKEHNLRGVRDSDRAIAKEQLKQVVEWGNEDCHEHSYRSKLKREEYNRKRHRCFECWQDLLKEIE